MVNQGRSPSITLLTGCARGGAPLRESDGESDTFQVLFLEVLVRPSWCFSIFFVRSRSDFTLLAMGDNVKGALTQFKKLFTVIPCVLKDFNR